MPPAIDITAYKPKPPKLGTGPKEFTLGDWLPRMRDYLELSNLLDVVLLPEDVHLANMNQQQRQANSRAKYLLLDSISAMYYDMVSSHQEAHRIWHVLSQVRMHLPIAPVEE